MHKSLGIFAFTNLVREESEWQSVSESPSTGAYVDFLFACYSTPEHDGGSLCTQGRPWKWGRSSLQPISAVLEIYCPAKSETWPHATGPKSAFSSANPRSRANGAVSLRA